MRRAVLAGLLLLFLCVPLTARAHPLGKFTTNQYVGLHLTSEGITVDYVLDLAEIPASQTRRDADTDGDGAISEQEGEAYAVSECRAAAAELDVGVGGEGVALTVDQRHLEFPEGEAGLPTLRLECRLEAPLTLSGPTELTLANDRYEDRQGWRELVVTTQDVAVDTELPDQSATQRLLTYPEDRLSSPVEVTSGTAVARPEPGTARGTAPPAPGASSTEAASTPVDALAALVDPRQGTPALPVAMAVALGLGILHSLAPGHGKTVMAAYLVGSRGTIGQAVGLGVAVAASHTVGVLALGLLTLVGTIAFAPERVFPILSVISGAIVVGIGLWMLVRWWRSRSRGTEVPDHGHAHAAGDAHTHGGVTHSHAVPAGLEGASGWKVLASMGLAGGLVPSTSAVVLLLASVNLGRVPLGLLLIALFGVGMATTLVGVGVGLVKVGDVGLARFGGSDWVRTARRLLTPVAATVVVVVGVFLVVNAL